MRDSISYPSLREVFAPNGDPAPGIVTTHDSFAVAFTRDEIISNVETLLQSENEDEARQHFRLCTQDQWNYKKARLELADGAWREKIIPLYYRPFDVRFTVYDSNVAVHRRERATRHLVGGDNIALLTSRMTKGEDFKHVQVTRLVAEVICMSPNTSNNGFVFPLWLRGGSALGKRALLGDRPEPNLGFDFLSKVCTKLRAEPSGAFGLPEGLSPGDVFHYAYAVLHSPGYRKRYMEFLRRDFPRLPLPDDLKVWRAIADRGSELVALHLMESPKLDNFVTTYTGPEKPEVGRVGWSDDTVWLDAGKTNAREGHHATKPGTIGFRSVPEAVWDFQIGGYQVCHKWLKDRKGRTLSENDLAHYQRIVVALNETIRLMKEIDEVIEKHGGWPGAFVTDKPTE